MRPRTKTEKEVYALHKFMPQMTKSQYDWMVKQARYENARRYNGRMTDIEHYIIVTVKNGWQVLRHYYSYSSFKYKKYSNTFVLLVMEQWFKDGKYVFLSRQRQGLSGQQDAWSIYGDLEVRRGRIGGGWLCDPRQLPYSSVRYARVQERFRHIPNDNECPYSISLMYTALNTHPFNETLFKNDRNAWEWSRKNGFLDDAKKTTALKIAIRHRYDYQSIEWRDLIENLVYLKKDVHNPTLVCPNDLHETHVKYSTMVANKKMKISKKMGTLRKIAEEHRELRRLQLQAEREEQRKKDAQAAIPYYEKMRKRFFGLVIAENDIEIQVLRTVQEFMEEGKAMNHCVFANGYYDVKKKPYCLILSARKDGKRMETIEVNLEDYTVVQSRGANNSMTPYHERIVNMVERNMGRIKLLNTKRGRTTRARPQRV